MKFNPSSNSKPKPFFVCGALVLCTLAGAQLMVGAAPQKRDSSAIALGCFKRMPNASPAMQEGFIVGACDSAYPMAKNKTKFRACVQNAKRKLKELKAANR